jgi:Protein of unknown function with HXXEE motif
VTPVTATATFGLAWLAATLALAIHVADEATHGFLAWYNPSALRIRRALGGVPFPPTFTFLPWLLALISAVVVLGALTPYAYRGTPWLRPLAYVLAAVHVGNGLLHLVASVLARRRVPGVLSAPILVLAGGWLAYVAATIG